MPALQQRRELVAAVDDREAGGVARRERALIRAPPRRRAAGGVRRVGGERRGGGGALVERRHARPELPSQRLELPPQLGAPLFSTSAPLARLAQRRRFGGGLRLERVALSGRRAAARGRLLGGLGGGGDQGNTLVALVARLRIPRGERVS